MRFFCAITFLSVSLLYAAPPRPNIVLIMVDDMGYSDIGCYGGEIETPNIDALAAGGVRFTQFYNSARCCPTRASLLTGLAPHQVGIGHMTEEEGPGKSDVPPAYRGNINDSCVTLAQVAKSAGYATFMTGKWHLSGGDRADFPLQRGFDRYYGCLAGASHHFQPYGKRVIYSGNDVVHDLKSTTDGPWYSVDAFTDHAIRFIDEHTAGPEKDQPFFLYLAHTAPHWPLHARDQELEKYREKYDIGWDRLRAQRYAKQLAIGLIPDTWKLSPRDAEVPPWEALNAEQKAECSSRMAAYAGMIDRLDQKIGDLVANLKKHNLYDNTLILFLSDNGACAEISLLGVGDPVADRAPGTDLTRPSYGRTWANVSATPYRQYKHFTHEGGSNTPFIAHWPARVPPGRDWFREPAQISDIMPTLIDLTGATYPSEFQGHAITPILGTPLTAAFDGKSLDRPRPLLIEHENNASIRDGEWKLVGKNVSPPNGLKPGKWELYHITEDGTELHDLAASQPERVKSMSAQWLEWANMVKVYPKVARKNLRN